MTIRKLCTKRIAWAGAALVAASVMAGGITLGARASQSPQIASPDLSTSTITVSSNAVYPGQVVTYTITFTNSGDLDAVVRLTDTLPHGVRYVTGTLTHTFSADAEVVIDFSCGALSVYASPFLSPTNVAALAFAVQAGAPGVITNEIQLEDQARSYSIEPVTVTVAPWQNWLPVLFNRWSAPASVSASDIYQMVVCDAGFGPDLLNGTPTDGTARSDPVTPPMAMVVGYYYDAYVNRHCLKRVYLAFKLDEAQAHNLSGHPVLVFRQHPAYAATPMRITVHRGTYTGDPGAFSPALWTGWEASAVGDATLAGDGDWRAPLNWMPSAGRFVFIVRLADESPGESRSNGAESAWLESQP